MGLESNLFTSRVTTTAQSFPCRGSDAAALGCYPQPGLPPLLPNLMAQHQTQVPGLTLENRSVLSMPRYVDKPTGD